MTKNKENKNSADTPLTALTAMLDSDMKDVNRVIIDNMQSDVPLIPQLAGYLIASGGKRIRPLLTLACTKLFTDDISRSYGLAAAVEFIHTATLLHDDVVDGSEQRRGKDAANLIFGNQASVLVGDFLFSRAFQLMTADGSLEILRILSGASAVIAQGEVMQLTTTNNLETSFAEYEQVIGAKTAALFAAACEIGPVIAGQDKDIQKAIRDYGYQLGMAFQVIDDILDYNADREKLGKTVGDDFREGKMTAPVILALQKADETERAFWQRTLQDKQQKDGDLEHAQELLTKHNCLTVGMDMAKGYAETARNALDTAPDSTIRTHLLDLVQFVIERQH